jgi:transketolase
MTEGISQEPNGRGDLDQLAVKTIRGLAMDAVQEAKSGHPGMPMGAAAMAHSLWTRHLRFDPTRPAWPDRDRFLLSAGHGSILLYSLLHLSGYDLSLDDLKAFRQWGSRTPGHPERGVTPGVEVTTGPLGQGFANGVGMAMAEEFLAATFNRPDFPLVDHFTYGIVSDGDLMEGVASEAASLAGHLALGKLIYLYDHNFITIEGPTQLSFTEDVGHRFAAYGWHVLQVTDGDDVDLVDQAVCRAKEVKDKPSLIIVRTHIAKGSPNKQDSADAHGAPLGENECLLTKEKMGWPPEPHFYIPEEVYVGYARVAGGGTARREAWDALFAAYAEAYPQEAALWERVMSGDLPDFWEYRLPEFAPTDGPMATRTASGKVLNSIAAALPTLIGGSADLAPSNNTQLKDCGEKPCGFFMREQRSGRNLRFGVREHAMGSIMNGLALHGGVFPYGGTFLVFADYMRPAIRLAALSQAHVVYVFTHDSVGVGEDGPTHQPIEHLASLRVIPGLTVIRPADANETAVAWRVALERKRGPSALILTRQNVPVFERDHRGSAEDLARGAYIFSDPHASLMDVLLMASGSELAVAMQARDMLAVQGVTARVVSFPSWELFEEQDQGWRDHVLPPQMRARIAVEAGVTFGWERYVGESGVTVGIDRFGASAPGERVMRELGITAQHVAEEALRLVR